MATTADRKVNLVPPKLQRLRRVRLSLAATLDDAQARRREIIERLRDTQNNLDDLRATPGALLDSKEKTELQKEVDAAKVAVERLDDLKSDVESEISELRADYRPLCGTVRSLEQHLGLREDEHLFEGHRVTGTGDNFQPRASREDANAPDFYQATKGGAS